jgi:hypothetical protein
MTASDDQDWEIWKSRFANEAFVSLTDDEQRIKRILVKHFWVMGSSVALSLIAKEISAEVWPDEEVR